MEDTVDADVAERVLGWRKVEAQKGTFPIVEYWFDGLENKAPVKHWRAADAMGEVIDAMANHGFNHLHLQRKNHGSGERWYAGFSSPNWACVQLHVGPTKGHAVAAAALALCPPKVVETEVERG